MKLYLVRHTAVDVLQGICYGQSNVRLKVSFSEEAAQVSAAINGKDINYDAAFMSPLSRCAQLAHYCGFKNAIPDNRLKERSFGDWEMQAWDAISDPNLQAWYEDWQHVRATNGESFQDLYQRFEDFIKNLPPLAEHVIIFTHSGIINCARLYAGLADLDNLLEDMPAYGSITEIELTAMLY